jgi:hypothetical protein
VRLTLLETYIAHSDDVEMEDAPVERDNTSVETEDADSEIEVDTPKPKKKAFESDSDEFKTPKVLKEALKRRAQLLAAEAAFEFVDMSSADSNGHTTDVEVESEDARESDIGAQTRKGESRCQNPSHH